MTYTCQPCTALVGVANECCKNAQREEAVVSFTRRELHIYERERLDAQPRNFAYETTLSRFCRLVVETLYTDAMWPVSATALTIRVPYRPVTRSFSVGLFLYKAWYSYTVYRQQPMWCSRKLRVCVVSPLWHAWSSDRVLDLWGATNTRVARKTVNTHSGFVAVSARFVVWMKLPVLREHVHCFN